MEAPKFVKYIGEENYYAFGLKKGDIAKVLSKATKDGALYVECPKESFYNGSSAVRPENLQGKFFNLIYDSEYELIEEESKKCFPKYVKFIGRGDGDGAGLKYGDIVEVLSTNAIFNDFLYVKTPLMNTRWWTDGNATNKKALEGQNFTYLSNTEYETIPENKIIKEEKKMDKQIFKVGDIVKGTYDSIYGITNAEMTEGVIIQVDCDGNLTIKVLKHTWPETVGVTFENLDPKYFALISFTPESAPLYNITTDMATFVEIEHDGVKAKSKCNTRYDKFDIYTGIDIAMGRLEEKENGTDKLKYVRITQDLEDSGLKKGDIVKVLSFGDITGFIYVSAKKNDKRYIGDAALKPSALEEKNFTYLASGEYEAVNFNIYD